MSPLKVSRCSHTNGSSEMEGAVSPSGSEEVLMCEMCQAVLCGKVIRWVTCLHGKYVNCPCIIVMWRNKRTSSVSAALFLCICSICSKSAFDISTVKVFKSQTKWFVVKTQSKDKPESTLIA